MFSIEVEVIVYSVCENSDAGGFGTLLLVLFFIMLFVCFCFVCMCVCVLLFVCLVKH